MSGQADRDSLPDQAERGLVHPLLGVISGMCTDEAPYTEIDQYVLAAKNAAHVVEAERDRLRAEVETLRGEVMARDGVIRDRDTENETLRGDVVRVVLAHEGLRSTVRRMARFAVDAHDLLTPGMKAGVAEAREALQACVELARTSDETEQPNG